MRSFSIFPFSMTCWPATIFIIQSRKCPSIRNPTRETVAQIEETHRIMKQIDQILVLIPLRINIQCAPLSILSTNPSSIHRLGSVFCANVLIKNFTAGDSLISPKQSNTRKKVEEPTENRFNASEHLAT